MDREIKFRGFNVQKNYMFDPMPIIDFKIFQLNNIPLMQFTGLKDMNGVDIYEGDIIKRVTIFEDSSGADVHLGILTWDNRNSRHYLHSIKNEISRGFGEVSENTTYEIIGNIFENPELLK